MAAAETGYPTAPAPADKGFLDVTLPSQKEWWASSATIGLMGFGLTTVLAGLSNLPPPYGNGITNSFVLAMAMAFGGSTQFAAGLIAMRKGNMFAGSAFLGYGAFWWAFTLMLWTNNPFFGTGITFYGIAAFTFVWMLFTIAFLINAPKHGVGITLVFLFLVIAFALLTVKFWMLAQPGTTMISTSLAWVVGGEIVFDGLIAYYVATADLTNWNYGRKVLPT
ncbi:MAG: acetate uptake transporter [Thermoplasmata archaeon]